MRARACRVPGEVPAVLLLLLLPLPLELAGRGGLTILLLLATVLVCVVGGRGRRWGWRVGGSDDGRGAEEHLDGVEGAARVAVGELGDELHGVVVDGGVLVRARAAHERLEVVLPDALHDDDAAPAQQRRVDLERRVLRRGADERHRAVLDRLQQRVLLRLVEPVDLVQEQHRLCLLLLLLLRAVSAGGAGRCGGCCEALARARGLDGALDLGDAAARGGGHAHERAARRLGEHAADARLAAARRAPEDERRQVAAVDRRAQHGARADRLRLAHDVVQRPRAQALCERRDAHARRQV